MAVSAWSSARAVVVIRSKERAAKRMTPFSYNEVKIPIAILHATRASIEPVNRYYTQNAPHLDIFNLLDDGLMRYLDQLNVAKARQRFLSMLATARDEYGAKMALLTCSAVPAETMEELRAWDPDFPMIKIDEPMAQMAVKHGERIGVLATFPATIATTEALLRKANARVDIRSVCVRPALEAIFEGDPSRHDQLITEAAKDLAALGQLDAVVLAQVSMAHLVEPLRNITGLPVYGSLDTSLAAVVEVLSHGPL